MMWDRRSQSLLVFLGDNNSIEVKFSYFLLNSRGLVVDLRNSLVRMSFSYFTFKYCIHVSYAQAIKCCQM